LLIVSKTNFEISIEKSAVDFKSNECNLKVLKSWGHPNWPEKTKPERSPAEQCRNVTVQNE